MVKENGQNKRERKRKMWLARIKAWQRSGLLPQDYCRRNNLSSRQFRYWKNEFGTEHGQDSVSFVPVPLPITPEALPINETGSVITVRLVNGIGIELPAEFNTTTLVRAVTALGGEA